MPYVRHRPLLNRIMQDCCCLLASGFAFAEEVAVEDHAVAIDKHEDEWVAVLRAKWSALLRSRP